MKWKQSNIIDKKEGVVGHIVPEEAADMTGFELMKNKLMNEE
jgi:hypothetical protein